MDKLSDRFMYYCGLLASHGVNVDDLKHIQNLIDKQEQGLLIELKLKSGDKFYMIQCGFVVPHIVVRIDISEDGIEYVAFGVSFTEDEIGKTIFLTKAEAEEALAKMGE